MPKWVYSTIGLSFAAVVLSVAYRILIGDGGKAGMGQLTVEVPPARVDLKSDIEAELPKDSLEVRSDHEESDFTEEKETVDNSVETAEVAVALVFDPPSNIRFSPNGDVMCAVTSKGSIRIYDKVDGWYRTDACGLIGVIHESQISFDPASIR